MNVYRVWFNFGNDEGGPRQRRIVAYSEKEAADILSRQLADNEDGFVIGKVEQM